MVQVEGQGDLELLSTDIIAHFWSYFDALIKPSFINVVS